MAIFAGAGVAALASVVATAAARPVPRLLLGLNERRLDLDTQGLVTCAALLVL